MSEEVGDEWQAPIGAWKWGSWVEPHKSFTATPLDWKKPLF